MFSVTTGRTFLPTRSARFTDKVRIMAFLDAHDFTQVKRYLIERVGMAKGYVEELLTEYKKYLCLRAMFPNAQLPICDAVDEVWHTHILFMRDYEAVCFSIAGQMLYHHPALDQVLIDRMGDEYLGNTIPLIIEHFGEADPRFWTRDAQVCKSGNCWGK